MKNENSFSDNNEQLLFSQPFYEFANRLTPNFPNMATAVREIIAALPPMADAFDIGLVTIHVRTPRNPFSKEFAKQDVLYRYEHGYQVKQVAEIQESTGADGSFYAAAYPRKGAVWSDTILEQITFVLKYIFGVTGRANMSTLLSVAAFTDYTTGAMNMTALHRLFGQQHNHLNAMDFSLLWLNLKGFKGINRYVGAKNGDQMLRSFAEGVMEILGPDEKIARPGGDNFVILLRKENVDNFLAKINPTKISIVHYGMERTFDVYSRIGLYDGQENDELEDMLSGANVAQDFAKRTPNAGLVVRYAAEMQEKLLRGQRIAASFKKALEGREFIVYYQPKVTLNDYHLCGCEALVRWFQNGKVIPPGEFLRVLETDGTITELDFYVLEQVCMDLRDWIDRGLNPLRISCNFSRHHLRNQSFADKIIEIMERYQIDSNLIEIELTETVTMEDADSMHAFGQRMREYGIATSIDDFGTGYSSLNMLRKFQADIIKLDKSFLDRLMEPNRDHQPDKTFIQNIVKMIQDMQMEVLAEGVENTEQAEFLKEISCNMAQGYLFDKPLPHDQYEKLLQQERFYIR